MGLVSRMFLKPIARNGETMDHVRLSLNVVGVGIADKWLTALRVQW